MDASRNETIKRAFVLSPEEVSVLNRLVRDFLRANAKVSFELTCNDGMVRHPVDAKALSNYDNTESSQITKLTVSGYSEDCSRRCAITLSGDSFWGNIRVSANGGEQAVATFFDSLTSLIQGMNPWYGRFATINFVSIFFAVLGVVSIVLALLGIAVLLYIGKPEILFQGDGRTIFVALSILCYTFLAGEALNWLRGKLFPLAVFAIGAGARRHETSDWWRKLAISTVLIGGVVVGGAVNFVVNAIMK